MDPIDVSYKQMVNMKLLLKHGQRLGGRFFVFCGAVFILSLIGFQIVAYTFYREVEVASITASTPDRPSDPHAPGNVLDKSTVETYTLNNYWIAKPKALDWIRLDFSGEYRIAALEILNTRHGLRSDIFSKEYEAIFLAGDVQAKRIAGVLPPYPTWHRITFAESDQPLATSIRIKILSTGPEGGGLNEVAILGEPAGGLSNLIHHLWPVFFALLLTGGVAYVYKRFPHVFGWPRAFLLLMIISFSLFGMYVLQYSTSVSAFEWGLLYSVKEFTEWSAISRFFHNLMVPIPPALALLEIIEYNLVGNIDFSIRYLYKASLILPYLAAIYFAYPRILMMGLAFAVSLVFLASTALIHPGNPQLYDTVFPFFFIAFIFFHYHLSRCARRDSTQCLVYALSGFFLSMATLCRPFVAFFVLPLLVLAVLDIRKQHGTTKMRQTVSFVVPVLVFVGFWHLFLGIAHGQWTMSNNSGFNIKRAWPMVEQPELLPEPKATGLYRGINNPIHQQNSVRLRNAVAEFIKDNPGDSAVHMLERICVTISGKTTILRGRLDPNHWIFGPYRFLVPAMSMWLFATFLVFLYRSTKYAFRSGHDFAAYLCLPQHLLTFLVLSSLLVTAVGEAGEEGRFLIQLLPMFVATIACQRWSKKIWKS